MLQISYRYKSQFFIAGLVVRLPHEVKINLTYHYLTLEIRLYKSVTNDN